MDFVGLKYQMLSIDFANETHTSHINHTHALSIVNARGGEDIPVACDEMIKHGF